MNDAKLLSDLLQGIITQLPILIAAFVGAIVTITRWKDAPSAGAWSLLGFGAAILLGILVPASQAWVRYWFIHNPGHPSDLAAVFTSLTVIWSLVRAASYIFLLVAIFAGRPAAPEKVR